MMRRALIAALLASCIGVGASSAGAEIVAFTGKTFAENALPPVVDFGTAGSRSLLGAVRSATGGFEDTDLVLLTLPNGPARRASPSEAGLVLRSEDGRVRSLALWVFRTGSVVLLPADLPDLSPVSLDAARLAEPDGIPTTLFVTGETMDVPEPSMTLLLSAGAALLAALERRRGPFPGH
jgi:hypothetical protein